MNIPDNPELLIVQRILGTVLGELLAKQYGTASVEIKCQGGQIVAMKYGIEQSVVNIHKMSAEDLPSDKL